MTLSQKAHDEARYVCGLDEAGRGALAGPLLVAGVVLPHDVDYGSTCPDIAARDSKALSGRQRIAFFRAVAELAREIATVEVEAAAINRYGINWANTTAFAALVDALDAHEYVIDGRWRLPDLGAKAALTSCCVRADESVPAAMAAGVVAKVVRDAIMQTLDRRFPAYGWASNTGHGTRSHLAALASDGLTPLHRTLFVSTAMRPAGQPRRSADRSRIDSSLAPTGGTKLKVRHWSREEALAGAWEARETRFSA